MEFSIIGGPVQWPVERVEALTASTLRATLATWPEPEY